MNESMFLNDLRDDVLRDHAGQRYAQSGRSYRLTECCDPLWRECNPDDGLVAERFAYETGSAQLILRCAEALTVLRRLAVM